MPTARELLEQADALMRRNRQDAARPSTMPPVPQAIEQPVPDLPLRVEPRIVGEPTLAVPAAQPAEAKEARGIDDAEIPVLEDAVEEDEVPLLTDAVDEIEVSAPGVEEGEPSDWLAHDTGEESVLGPAPPSVALVPPATVVASAVQREAGALDTRTAPIAEAFHAPSPVVPPPEIEDLVPEPVDPDVTLRREGASPATAKVAPRSPLEDQDDRAGSGAAELDAVENWTGPGYGTPVPDPVPVTLPRVSPTAPDHSREEAIGAFRVPPSTASPPQPELPVGAEREALAEEIRMQVLQRIDMFTDAGLRERLGERLKPIVDRASADLVDAINQHVGEILRAYVAEAIEREIDRWRSGRA